MMTEEQKQKARDNLAKARAAKKQKIVYTDVGQGEVTIYHKNTEPVKVQTDNAVSPMTPEEKAISSRIMSEAREWATVDPYATNDFSLSEDPFKLPEPALKLQNNKQFKFRWVHRTAERIDEVKNMQMPFRWWPVNSTQPEGKTFDRFIDSSTGGVHLLDQILVFKPWNFWEAEQKIQNRLNDSRGDLTEKDGQEKNDLRLAASKRKAGESRSRTEISGEDIEFRGEAEFDGGNYETVSDSDMVVNE